MIAQRSNSFYSQRDASAATSVTETSNETPGALISERWVHAALLAFAIGMAIWWPRVLVIGDEERYVAQALAFADGTLTVAGSGIIHPRTPLRVMSDFPPGTSLIQVPFVLLGGWRAAAAASLFCLVLATLITAKWLRDSGRQPGFALLVPGFFGAAFFGRVAMSDVPSAATVAGALWMLWRATRAREGAGLRGWSFAAAAMAALSLLFRETNAILLLPVFIHVLVQHRATRAALISGAATGLALRLGLSAAFFGSAFYVRDSGYGFSFASLGHTAAPYALILFLLFPLGGVLPFFYRGERAKSLNAAVLAYVLLYLLYEYDSISENGPVKGLVLATRYMVPVTPVLAFMAAEVFPRWYAALRGDGLRRVAATVTRLAAAAMVTGAFLVHALASAQEAVPATIAGSIMAHTDSATPVITNNKATLKYLSPAYGPRRIILRDATDSLEVARLYREQGVLSLVLLDRNDSELFREDARENERFLQRVRRQCDLVAVHDSVPAAWARLRVLETRHCQ